MSKHTKTEIDLCQQIAEKYRKEIEYGDWYHYRTEAIPKPVIHPHWKYPPAYERDAIPLWTIEDCLEFLREKGFRYNLEDYRVLDLDSSELVQFIISGGNKKYCRRKFEGKTPLEACLKAVLAVLKEDK